MAPLNDDMVVGSHAGPPKSTLEDGTHVLTLTDVKPRTRQRGAFANPCKTHAGDSAAGIGSTRPEAPRCEKCQYPDDIREVFEFWFTAANGDQFTMESGQSTNEKSKLIKTISPALNGGITAGSEIKARAINVMIGRKCYGQIAKNAGGWPKLINLIALPNEAGLGINATDPAYQPPVHEPDEPEFDEFGNPIPF